MRKTRLATILSDIMWLDSFTDEDYTAKLVIGVKNGETYYDHALTKIEKNNLLRSIDEIKRPFASKETTDDESQAFDFLSECKDKRLISILQI